MFVGGLLGRWALRSNNAFFRGFMPQVELNLRRGLRRRMVANCRLNGTPRNKMH